MRFRLFQRVVWVITLGAFFGAGMMQPAWSNYAAPSSPAMAMMSQADDAAPMPCKGMAPACMTDLGCIVMIGMPTVPSVLTATRLSWSRVRYDYLSKSADSLARKPALDPPIFLG